MVGQWHNVKALPMLRPVLPQDVSSLARALLAVPAGQRGILCRQFFDLAERALAHVGKTGQLHPNWGNGSLDAVARAHVMAPEPFWHDPSYLDCLILVLKELRRRCV